MSMQDAATKQGKAAGLDAESLRAVVRVVMFLCFCGLWCALIHLITARPVTPVPMLLMAAGMAVAFAVSHRERPLAASLNRWDEAMAFLGLAALARMVVIAIRTGGAF